MKINDNIRELRTDRGWSCEELGKKVGVARQTIMRYESGVISNVPYDKIVALADAFGVTPAYLMGWEDDGQTHRICLADLGILEVQPDSVTMGKILATYIEKFFSLSEGHQEQIKEVIDMFAEKDGDNDGK